MAFHQAALARHCFVDARTMELVLDSYAKMNSHKQYFEALVKLLFLRRLVQEKKDLEFAYNEACNLISIAKLQHYDDLLIESKLVKARL